MTASDSIPVRGVIGGSLRLLVATFAGTGDCDDVQGVGVRRGGDGFGLTGLARRGLLDGDAVVATVGQSDVGEDEVAVLRNLDFLLPLEFEHQSFVLSGKSLDLASDGVAI